LIGFHKKWFKGSFFEKEKDLFFDKGNNNEPSDVRI
jgi:hypothetical protein